MRPRQLLAICHESANLGSFESLLCNANFFIRYADISTAIFAESDLFEPELLVILGAAGGNCQRRYRSFIENGLAMIERRLDAGKPTLGIGDGCQLLAQAIGARAYAGATREIGWSPLILTSEGRRSALRYLDGTHMEVFHWHSDTFDLPPGATPLASTLACTNQAFSCGETVLGLQFHPEVRARELAAWYAARMEELVTQGISLERLQLESAQYAPVLQAYAEPFLHAWLASAGL